MYSHLLPTASLGFGVRCPCPLFPVRSRFGISGKLRCSSLALPFDCSLTTDFDEPSSSLSSALETLAVASFAVPDGNCDDPCSIVFPNPAPFVSTALLASPGIGGLEVAADSITTTIASFISLQAGIWLSWLSKCLLLLDSGLSGGGVGGLSGILRVSDTCFS